MLKKIKSKVLIVASFFALLMPASIIVATPVYADLSQDQINNSLKCGSNVNLDTNQTCRADEGTNTQSLEQKIAKIINIFSAVVGIIAVIMIIYGGLRYVASGGKQESVTSAKNTLLYAIVGLVIVAFAQAIVHFVLRGSTT